MVKEEKNLVFSTSDHGKKVTRNGELSKKKFGIEEMSRKT